MRDRYVRSGEGGGEGNREEQSFHDEWREIIFGSATRVLSSAFYAIGRDRVPCLFSIFEHIFAGRARPKERKVSLEFRRQWIRGCTFREYLTIRKYP